MTDPDPNETQIVTVPFTGEPTTVRLTGPSPSVDPAGGSGSGSGSGPAPGSEASNGTQASVPPLRPPGPPSSPRPEPREAPERDEPRVAPPPPPTLTVLPRTPPQGSPNPSPGPPPPPVRTAPVATSVGSRWMLIHPHVSFFGWLADKQGPADVTPEERLQRYRQQSPWLFRTCVMLDLLVLFVVTAIVVVALGAALFKAIFGVI